MGGKTVVDEKNSVLLNKRRGLSAERLPGSARRGLHTGVYRSPRWRGVLVGAGFQLFSGFFNCSAKVDQVRTPEGSHLREFLIQARISTSQRGADPLHGGGPHRGGQRGP